MMDAWVRAKEQMHWHRLPKEAVDAPPLEELEARRDGALGSLNWQKVTLSMAEGGGGGVELDDL